MCVPVGIDADIETYIKHILFSIFFGVFLVSFSDNFRFMCSCKKYHREITSVFLKTCNVKSTFRIISSSNCVFILRDNFYTQCIRR